MSAQSPNMKPISFFDLDEVVPREGLVSMVEAQRREFSENKAKIQVIKINLGRDYRQQ